jgi:Domain of unknown function (DUF4252)
MKTLLLAMVMAVLACELASAQKVNLDFSTLAAKATAKKEVTLKGGVLQILGQVASLANRDDKGNAGDFGTMLPGIDGIKVRQYEFAMEGEYSDRDLEPLRQQVGNGSGWSRIVNKKEKDESTEIYIYHQGGKLGGMLLIAAKAKELTVVHISGSAQLAQLKDLVNSTIHYDLGKVSAAGATQ